LEGFLTLAAPNIETKNFTKN